MSDDVDKDEDTMPGVGTKTATLPVVDPILAALARIEAQQGTQGEKLDTCIHGLSVVTNEVEKQAAEIRDFREWKGGVEQRLGSHSIGARTLSVNDGTQDVKLKELENRLAAQAESSMRAIVGEMTKAAAAAAKTPTGQRVVQAGGAALLAFFVLATVYFGALTARLQAQQPPQVVQQVAPTVIYADGGP